MAFLNGVYEPVDLDINIGKELTLVQISERCRLTWHEHDQWKMTPPSWPVPLLENQSEELSYPFRSVQCTLVDGLKSFFCRLHGSYFVVELKLQSALFCFSVNSKLGTKLNYFCTGFCHSDRFASGYRSCFVAVTVFTTSSVFTFP